MDKHSQPGSRKQKIGMRYLWVHHHNHNQPTQDIPPPTKHTPHIHQLLATKHHPGTHTHTTQPTKTTKPASQASQPTRTLSIAASTHAFHSKPGQPQLASQQASKPARPLINHSRSNQLLDNHLLDNVARLARYVPGLFALLIQPASLLIKAS